MKASWVVIGVALGCSTPKPASAPTSVALEPVRLELDRAVAHGGAAPAPLLQVMRAELDRSFVELKSRGDPPPYFMAYEVVDGRAVVVAAEFGALLQSDDVQTRDLDVDVRVGDPKLDNTHRLRDKGALSPRRSGGSTSIPIEDDPAALRSAMWLATDERYKDAAERLVKVKSERAINVADDDASDDFSADPPGALLEAPAAIELDRKAWEERVKALSGVFRLHADLEGKVELAVSAQTHYLASSEGASLQRSATHVRLIFTAQTTASDGMNLHLQDTVDASSVAKLPDQATLQARVRALVDQIEALRTAPVAEPYVGPAILDGRAASVFFHETFGHRVEGHRQKDDQEGQTFARKIGERIMPDFINVWDDPTVRTLNGTELNGYYPFDDEGTLAQRVSLVESGVLKGFLMSRTPVRGFSHSNGHGRRASGREVVARQANLVVDPASVHTTQDLKSMLLAEVKRQGKPYGLRFADVEGGYTTTARADIQAFRVRPVVVYRVFPDGREELVRGVDLEGTPLTSLSTILAAGNDFAVFNGFCGAESGWVPVSAASPSLLVGQMEVAHKNNGYDKPPILPPPGSSPAPEAHAVEPPGDDGPLVRAMRDELTRAAERLHLPDGEKPYYVALRMSERTDVGVVASFGAVVRKYVTRGRYLRPDVRVGDYLLDNSNFAGARSNFSFERLPTEDDYDAIRLDVWHAMDRAYKQAAGDYARKMAAHKTQNQAPDDVGDFSSEKPSRIVVRRAAPPLDVDRTASMAKEVSAVAKNFPEIQSGDVAVNGGSARQVFVSNEGTFADEDDALVTLTATLRTQAVDGMPLTRVVSFSGASLDALPSRDVLEKELTRAAQELTTLRRASEAEDYAGPVLFEAPAAAQLIRDVLAPQLCGTPAPKSESGGLAGRSGLETELSGRIGQRVMPAGFRVEDDPTIDRLGALALVSRYGADDEGVAAQKVTLIEHGLLERFLMSRTPRKGFDHSNGHARAMFVMPPRAAISNLLVSADKGLSAGDLRKKLLAEAKAEGLSYGLVVKELDDAASSGNFAAMFRSGRGDSVPPPLVLVKVTADGKEEPVRGATFGTLPLRAFEEILAAGREPAVVSRMVPIASSVVAPAMLFKRIEIKKPQGPQRKLPALAHPYFADNKK